MEATGGSGTCGRNPWQPPVGDLAGTPKKRVERRRIPEARLSACDLGRLPVDRFRHRHGAETKVKTWLGLPIQNDMRAGPSPDQPLNADEARSWARIESALRDEVYVSRWNPRVGLRDERAFSVGLLLVGIGAIVAGLAALPAPTVVIVGLSILSGGLGVALTATVLRNLVPALRRRRALAPQGDGTSQRFSRISRLAFWRNAARLDRVNVEHNRRVDS